MKKSLFRLMLFMALLPLSSLSSPLVAEETVLVNGVVGRVYRVVSGAKAPVSLFSTLSGEENFLFSPDSRLKLLYKKNGRQETWGGAGHLIVRDGKASTQDLPDPQVKMIDRKVVMQLFRSPQVLPEGAIKIPRTRSLGTPEAIARLESDYRRMRMESTPDDLNPEMYRLSSLLEMREKERLEQALKELPRLYPGNMEAHLLLSLYRKSIKEMSF